MTYQSDSESSRPPVERTIADILVYTRPDMENTTGIYEDRNQAGRDIVRLLKHFRIQPDLVMGVVAGGIPTAEPIARALAIRLAPAVVSKITLPRNTEAGYGAVAFDGSLALNDEMVRRLNLPEETISEGIIETRRKVRRRSREMGLADPDPLVSGRSILLVDDGLASGYTLRVAISAVATHGPREIFVAVPTAHLESITNLQADLIDGLICPNIRMGPNFAVAAAYRQWSDVTEDQARQILQS
ncbi:MAG: phosphoribosyltransferase [Phycisphaerae bacterium]